MQSLCQPAPWVQPGAVNYFYIYNSDSYEEGTTFGGDEKSQKQGPLADNGGKLICQDFH
jgi:hypothetical protein